MNDNDRDNSYEDGGCDTLRFEVWLDQVRNELGRSVFPDSQFERDRSFDLFVNDLLPEAAAKELVHPIRYSDALTARVAETLLGLVAEILGAHSNDPELVLPWLRRAEAAIAQARIVFSSTRRP